MPYFPTSEEWQRQSALLLQARPTTARITTKYNIPNLESPKYKKRKLNKKSTDAGTDSAAADGVPKVPRATLTLKTYDPESGVCLKYRTDRAQEVGRLMASLGRLGRHMAALPEVAEAPEPHAEETTTTEPTAGLPTLAQGKEAPAQMFESKAPAGAGTGGGKKKKKGKK